MLFNELNFTKIEDWNKRFNGISFRSWYFVQQYLGESVWKVKHYIRNRKIIMWYSPVSGIVTVNVSRKIRPIILLITFTTVKRENNFKVNILLIVLPLQQLREKIKLTLISSSKFQFSGKLIVLPLQQWKENSK